MNDQESSDLTADPPDPESAGARDRRPDSSVSTRAYFVCLGVGVLLYFLGFAIQDGPEPEECYDCESDRHAWLMAGLVAGVPVLLVHLILSKFAVNAATRTGWPAAVVGVAANVAVSCLCGALLILQVAL